MISGVVNGSVKWIEVAGDKKSEWRLNATVNVMRRKKMIAGAHVTGVNKHLPRFMTPAAITNQTTFYIKCQFIKYSRLWGTNSALPAVHIIIYETLFITAIIQNLAYKHRIPCLGDHFQSYARCAKLKHKPLPFKL